MANFYSELTSSLLILVVASALLVVFFVYRLVKFARCRKLDDSKVTALLRAEDARFTAEEDAQSRHYFSKARLASTLGGADEFDAVFIGSGPGSMACAATLARVGWRVAVFEQGEQLGGGAHVFKEAGFEFETGVHYLGHDAEMEDLLDFLTCGRLELARIGSPVSAAERAADWSGPAGLLGTAPRAATEADSAVMYDNVVIEGTAYPFVEGEANLRSMLETRFPAQLGEIARFFVHIKLVLAKPYKVSSAMFFRMKVPGWLPTWLRRTLQKLAGASFYKYTQLTTEELLRSCGIEPASPLGSVLLGQYGDTGVRPDKCSSMMHLGVMTHYIKGSKYPVGGSGAIPRKMNAVILAAGGRSFVQAPVDGLIYAKGRAGQPKCVGVRVKGVDVRARIVVSGIGAARSYSLIGQQIPSIAKPALANIAAATELSVAFIFLFLGLDVTDIAPSDEDERSHNTWIYPERDYTAMEKRIEGGSTSTPWAQPMPMFVASGSAKDRAWAATHPGKKTIVVLSQCPWAWCKEWATLSHAEREKSATYQAFKDAAKATMMEQGFRKVFPKLEKYITHSTIGTPLSTNNFLATEEGECYGLAATPKRWMVNELSPHTPIENLYLTGQDTLALGLSSSLQSGYLTANVLMGYGAPENVLLKRDIIVDLGLPPIFG